MSGFYKRSVPIDEFQRLQFFFPPGKIQLHTIASFPLPCQTATLLPFVTRKQNMTGKERKTTFLFRKLIIPIAVYRLH